VITALRAAGVQPGTMAEPCRPGSAVITFDDGAAHVPALALGPLAENGFRAIQYLCAGLLGGTNEWDTKNGHASLPLMDEGAVREWLAAGHDIGSHTMTHRNLGKCAGAEAREEIFASKKKLEDTFGREVRHFCYPHGRWTPEARALVAEAGYSTACATQSGMNAPGADPLLLRRNFPLSSAALLAKAGHRLARKLRLAGR
jgi:peptidoglycan/xylan/chitin deacetylase (PgdA/CDA1 family)